MTGTPNSKSAENDDKYYSILNATLKLEILKGHLKWTMADLSRASGIGRTLIYYYFGKSKKDILAEAVRGMSRNIWALDDDRKEKFTLADVRESILRAREFVSRAPYSTVFYFQWRPTATPVGDLLRETELAYFKKLEKFAGGKSKAEHEALYSCFIGLVVAPNVSNESIDLVLQHLL